MIHKQGNAEHKILHLRVQILTWLKMYSPTKLKQ